MTVDLERANTLMDEVKQVAMEIPAVYREGGPPLATEQHALLLFRKAAAILSEILVTAPVGSITHGVAERLHAKVVSQLIESARTCMALEDALLMSEAAAATKH